jgi:pimeloyl-ACP methyl ester carboxylesterase
MAEDIAALIADLGTEPILVGHSLGGLTATHCATTAPESVRALVLVDIGPSSFARGAAATLAASGAAANEAAALFPPEPQAFETFETFVDHALRLNPRRNRAQLSVSLSHNARALPDGRWTWKYDQRHFGRHAVRSDPGAFDPTWEALESFHRPVLVIRGEQSRILNAEGAAALAARVPNGDWVEIPDAGHTVHGDNPKAFISALEKFIDKVQ